MCDNSLFFFITLFVLFSLFLSLSSFPLLFLRLILRLLSFSLSVNSVSYRILLSKSIPLVGPIVHLFFCVRHFFLLLSIDEQTFFRKITDSIVWYLRHILCWIKSITKYGREKHSSMYRRLKLNILCCSVKKIGIFFNNFNLKCWFGTS